MSKKFLSFFLFLLIIETVFAQEVKHTFAYSDTQFLLDGKSFQIISAEMHYPRIPKEAWRDRMQKAKAMGINTIGTYVFWNLHEPHQGVFDFKGDNDIVQFVKIAQEEGLWVIVRPSPYVCAEWEFGGYPYWLQNIPNLKVRSMEANYVAEYKKYIMEIGKLLAPLQINHGGNILMTQVENEYGFYSDDKQYLDLNRKMFVEAGFDGLLYTCDPEVGLEKGNLPGLLPAVNGVNNPKKAKKLINKVNNGKGPYFVAEWYPAWFDWWGTKHHTVPAEDYSGKLDTLLSAGVSLNMYMFHGGTTRGFMNGANFNDKTPYEPQISSYDYDAPLDEAGNPTEKFVKFKEAIVKNLPQGTVTADIPKTKPSIETPEVIFIKNTTIFNLLPKPIISKNTKTFEQLNQPYGFVLYRTHTLGGKNAILKIKDLRDYGIVFINGKRVGNLDRRLYQDSLQLSLPKGKVQLDILVENMGRINFGPYLLKNTKGITEAAYLNGKALENWKIYQLPFDELSTYTSKNETGIKHEDTPVLKQGYFEIEKPADTYLDFSNWGKGVAWVNGHNLGKYWSIGPQQTVYVPVEWLKAGKNNIVVLELLKPQQNKLKGINKSILNQLQK